MSYPVHCDDARIVVDILRRRPELCINLGDVAHTVVEVAHAGAQFELVIDGQVHRGWRCRVGNEVWVRLGNRSYVVRRAERESDDTTGPAARSLVRADMPGIVVAIHCATGQGVKAGDKLMTIESMKLQVTLIASHDAAVEQIHVAPNVTFERGALLVTLGEVGQGASS